MQETGLLLLAVYCALTYEAVLVILIDTIKEKELTQRYTIVILLLYVLSPIVFLIISLGYLGLLCNERK